MHIFDGIVLIETSTQIRFDTCRFRWIPKWSPTWNDINTKDNGSKPKRWENKSETKNLCYWTEVSYLFWFEKADEMKPKFEISKSMNLFLWWDWSKEVSFVHIKIHSKFNNAKFIYLLFVRAANSARTPQSASNP